MNLRRLLCRQKAGMKCRFLVYKGKLFIFFSFYNYINLVTMILSNNSYIFQKQMQKIDRWIGIITKKMEKVKTKSKR